MNQNKDCNCKDGIQKVASNMSDRYPYANDSSTALQNVNYKEWLTVGQERGGNSGDLERNARIAVMTGMNIAGTMMGGCYNSSSRGGCICNSSIFDIVTDPLARKRRT